MFTYGYSLKEWADSGFIEKELKYFKKFHEKYDASFVLVTYGGNEDLSLIDKSQYPYLEILPIYTITKKFKYKIINFIFSFFIPIKLKSFVSNIDLIKQNQLLGSWVSIFTKYMLSKPLYIRTGYDMYLFSKKENKSNLKKLLYFLLTKFSISLSDAYSVTSYSDLKFLQTEFKLNDDHLYKISNWIEDNKKLEFNNRLEKNILCIGRLEYQKNFEYIIREFANSEFTIDLVGSGSQRNYLEKLARNLNTSVNFLGQKTYSELLDLYNKYRYYVASSLFEGNPKTTLEAMASGNLVLVSDIENNREIIPDGGGIFFNFEESVLNILLTNLEDIKNIKTIVEKGYSQTIKFNSLEKIVSEEMSLINILLK